MKRWVPSWSHQLCVSDIVLLYRHREKAGQQHTHLARQRGCKKAQEPVRGNDRHLTPRGLQMLMKLWKLVVSQLLQQAKQPERWIPGRTADVACKGKLAASG